MVNLTAYFFITKKRSHSLSPKSEDLRQRTIHKNDEETKLEAIIGDSLVPKTS